jgi:hypothetical protein
MLTKTKSTGTSDTYCNNEANQLCRRKVALDSPYSSASARGAPRAGATLNTYDADGEQPTGSGGTATYSRAMQMTAFGATSVAYAGLGRAERTADRPDVDRQLASPRQANSTRRERSSHEASASATSNSSARATARPGPSLPDLLEHVRAQPV